MQGQHKNCDQSTLVVIDNEWEESNPTPNAKLKQFIREGWAFNTI